MKYLESSTLTAVCCACIVVVMAAGACGDDGDPPATPDASLHAADATPSKQDAMPAVDITQPGFLQFGDEISIIVVPSTGQVGVPFQINIMTFGGPCTSVSSTDVQYESTGVLVTPFDRTQVAAGTACPARLDRFYHMTELTFGSVGDRTVRIQGKRMWPNSDVTDVEIIHSVTIE